MVEQLSENTAYSPQRSREQIRQAMVEWRRVLREYPIEQPKGGVGLRIYL